MVAAAIIGSAVAGVAGSVISANGAQSAAQTQANAATQNEGNVLAAGQQANAQDLGAIGQANAPLQSYVNLGNQASGSLSNLLTGLGNGNAMNALQTMPGYQFELQQGLQAAQNGYAAKGLGSSGSAMKGAAQYAQGLASSDLGQYYNQLMGGVQAGGAAAASQSQNIANLNQAGANALMGGATNAASLGMAGASAAAAGQIGAANAISGGLTNLGNTVMQGTIASQQLQQGAALQNALTGNMYGGAYSAPYSVVYGYNTNPFG